MPLSRPTGRVSPVIRICCTGAMLALVLIGLRARLLISHGDLRPPDRFLAALPSALYDDFTYLIALIGASLGLCFLARGHPTIQRAIAVAVTLAAFVSTILGLVNLRAVAELGQPINYQWLYYSHFMRSLDTYTALADLVSWSSIRDVSIACLILLLASEGVARWASRRTGRHSTAHRLGVAIAGISAVYVALGWSFPSGEWKPASMKNPVLALVGSFLEADTNPVLAKMPTRFGPEDFQTAEARGTTPTSPYTARARRLGIQNVILVVLESVAAEYVSGFEPEDPGLTPELRRYQMSARRFPRFYAHQPSTTHSLLALLLSVFPPHSFRAITREHPDIALPSLSGELKRRGYRTAFLNAQDNRFQRADVFLAHRQFDLIADARTHSCTVSTESRPDQCMVDKLFGWIGRDSSQPFFAVLWTVQTHFPYLSSRDPAKQVIASVEAPSRQQTEYLTTRYNRYRRALHESDRAVGRLLRRLEQADLLQPTLVVIVGDHGEAFGQHGYMFHRFLYEEEVRIPLLIINPRLFQGEVDSTLGGTIDIAPTVLDLLGLPRPGQWQGQSLFEHGRRRGVYLFGPYSGLFGYREGNDKLIYNPIAGESELYDLSTDPEETLNLAGKFPELVQSGRERLAAWVQYQHRFFREHGVLR